MGSLFLSMSQGKKDKVVLSELATRRSPIPVAFSCDGPKSTVICTVTVSLLARELISKQPKITIHWPLMGKPRFLTVCEHPAHLYPLGHSIGQTLRPLSRWLMCQQLWFSDPQVASLDQRGREIYDRSSRWSLSLSSTPLPGVHYRARYSCTLNHYLHWVRL